METRDRQVVSVTEIGLLSTNIANAWVQTLRDINYDDVCPLSLFLTTQEFVQKHKFFGLSVQEEMRQRQALYRAAFRSACDRLLAKRENFAVQPQSLFCRLLRIGKDWKAIRSGPVLLYQYGSSIRSTHPAVVLAWAREGNVYVEYQFGW